MCGMIWLFFSMGMDFKKKLLNSLTSCLKVNWGSNHPILHHLLFKTYFPKPFHIYRSHKSESKSKNLAVKVKLNQLK